jgi:uncharacterized membrane protein YbaN (DUF454 family)
MTFTTHASAAKRGLYGALGLVAVAFAILGVFVPGLPTTVFVIAASYLFSRSSQTLSAWLEQHRWLGPPLRRFRDTRGMPARSKVLALLSMWAGAGTSLYALAAVGTTAQLAALALALTGTAVILFAVRTTAARQPLILS